MTATPETTRTVHVDVTLNLPLDGGGFLPIRTGIGAVPTQTEGLVVFPRLIGPFDTDDRYWSVTHVGTGLRIPVEFGDEEHATAFANAAGTRIWDPSRPAAVFVMLNPSTADALDDDPTIRRCKVFAAREGAGGIVVVNLFALRSTDPRALLHHADPVGPANDAFIRQAVRGAHTVVAAWGAAGVQGDRAGAVAGILGRLRVPVRCLGVTATGQPRHPLYLPKDAVLERYGVAA